MPRPRGRRRRRRDRARRACRRPSARASTSPYGLSLRPAPRLSRAIVRYRRASASRWSVHRLLVGAEPLDHHHRWGRRATGGAVVDADAVGGAYVRHQASDPRTDTEARQPVEHGAGERAAELERAVRRSGAAARRPARARPAGRGGSRWDVHRRADLDAAARRSGAEQRHAGSTRDPCGDGGADQVDGRPVPPTTLSTRVSGAEHHQLARRASAPSSSAGDRQQAAEPLQQRPDRCDVGPADEAHRAPDRVADGERREHRGQRHSWRALTTISAPPRRGRCSVPPTATSHRRRLAANARATGVASRSPSRRRRRPTSRAACGPCRPRSRRRRGPAASPPRRCVLIGLAIRPPAAGRGRG